jgi:RNA polymerase sigma factor (sigma-70 family)
MNEVNIQDHIALCHWMARRYVWSKASYEDMVSSGIEGLAIAKERFDPSKGYKFVTYATWYVRSYVQKVVNHHIKENHRSLDAQDENGRTGLDKIADEEADVQIEMKPQIHLLLAALSKKESTVIGRRFGVEINVPSRRRESIRISEAAALNDMKRSV